MNRRYTPSTHVPPFLQFSVQSEDTTAMKKIRKQCINTTSFILVKAEMSVSLSIRLSWLRGDLPVQLLVYETMPALAPTRLELVISSLLGKRLANLAKEPDADASCAHKGIHVCHIFG
ncbi:hypothetical protein PROFUN_09869 [Planoprotostelium fungivorum]|uniref:Uncharacterized protein n=1 Tax=Planoprotostelium fungivorum TaxID=1890364 RepID=A0A2P6NGD4_9EUKA|nr:hypothetical protein PROFUN_09869 [Planoprotostelium fungivorum]